VSSPRATELGCTVVDIVTFWLPSNDTEPATSPDREIVLAVSNCDAVSALPVKSPVTFPVIVPTTVKF
jgi:hypothetical protein